EVGTCDKVVGDLLTAAASALASDPRASSYVVDCSLVSNQNNHISAYGESDSGSPGILTYVPADPDQAPFPNFQGTLRAYFSGRRSANGGVFKLFPFRSEEHTSE